MEEDRTRKIPRARTSPTQPAPQRSPSAPSSGGGPDFKTIAAGAVAVLVLAAGGYAVANIGSGSPDPGGKPSPDKPEDRPDGSVPPGGGDDPDDGNGTPSLGEEQPDPDVPEPTAIPPFREDCGNDVYAAGSASCPFSRNIAAQYRDLPASILYDVYSPTTRSEYTVECSEAGYVTCTGGANATVYFYR